MVGTGQCIRNVIHDTYIIVLPLGEPSSKAGPRFLWSAFSDPNTVGAQMLVQLVQFSLSVVSDCLGPHVWEACQASLSITNSQSLLKFMSMPSNHLILCHPLLHLPSIFPSIRVFSSKSVLCIRWPNIGASVLASVLPMNIQG